MPAMLTQTGPPVKISKQTRATYEAAPRRSQAFRQRQVAEELRAVLVRL